MPHPRDPDPPGAPPAPSRSRRVRVTLAVASAVALGALAFLGIQWQRLTARVREAGPRAVAAAAIVATGAAIPTVAVLPFDGAGGDAPHAYLGDGIRDELAYALGRVPGLRVAGRVSSYTYRGRPAPASEVGRALGVAGVVDGTVQRTGDRLRVTARLTRALDDSLLWTGSYESADADLFGVQRTMTQALVGVMLPALADSVAATVADARRGTHDPLAYDHFLRGRHEQARGDAAGLTSAIRSLRAAVAQDPRFARAHAALALAYGATADRSAPRDSAAVHAASSALRAAALDTSLAEAHLARGIALQHEWHLADAEGHYRAAAALDPASAPAHQSLGLLLAARGRVDESITALGVVRRLDPLATAPEVSLGMALLFARRFPESIDTLSAALARDSAAASARSMWALALALGGRPDSAARLLETILRRDPATPGARGLLVLAHAANGRWPDAESARARLRGRARATDAERGLTDLVFGDREPLVRLLDTPVGRQAWLRTYWSLGCNPLLDPLWTDPRVVASMRGIGVEPCALARPWPLTARAN